MLLTVILLSTMAIPFPDAAAALPPDATLAMGATGVADATVLVAAAIGGGTAATAGLPVVNAPQMYLPERNRARRTSRRPRIRTPPASGKPIGFGC